MDAEIVSLRGPLVELRHPETSLPEVFDRFATSEGVEVVIASRNGQNSLAIAERDHDALHPGARLRESAPRFVPLTPERMIEVGFALDDGFVSSRIAPTGLRVLDLLCPLLDGGSCWLLGDSGLGRMQLLEELHRRLAATSQRQTFVFPLHPDNAGGLAKVRARPEFPADVAGNLRNLWIVSEHVANPIMADLTPLGASRVFLGPRAPARGYWPAIDFFASHSSALSRGEVEPMHIELAADALQLLAWAEDLRADEEFDLLVNQRRFREAIARTIELGVLVQMKLRGADVSRFQHAMHLERYFAQPIFLGKKITGLTGTHTSYGDALRGCSDVISGRHPTGGYDYPARPGSFLESLDTAK